MNNLSTTVAIFMLGYLDHLLVERWHLSFLGVALLGVMLGALAQVIHNCEKRAK